MTAPPAPTRSQRHRILEVFLDGARQITDHDRFTRHHADGQVDWAGAAAVLSLTPALTG